MKFTGMHEFMHCMIFFFFFLSWFLSFLLGGFFLTGRSCELRGQMFESRSRPKAAVSQSVCLFGHKKAHSPPLFQFAAQRVHRFLLLLLRLRLQHAVNKLLSQNALFPSASAVSLKQDSGCKSVRICVCVWLRYET